MTIGKEIRQYVRERAHFSCEYCGVSETDTGSELTIDHYQPPLKKGSDSPDNLVYCCHRCNEYKGGYFPETPELPFVWNPRLTPASYHFIELEDGTIKGVTQEGQFTIRLLKLNRVQLIALRFKKRRQAEEQRLLKQALELSAIMKQTNEQINNLSQQQQSLLEEQLNILKLLIGKDI